LDRRKAIVALAAFAGAVRVAPALAQQSGKVWRIGVLETQSASLNAANLDALKEGLRVLGYEQGKNVAIEYRSAEGRGERFPALAAQLIRLPVDVIVTRGTPAAIAARNATAQIPIVMAAIGEPLMVVASLARPGGNVTGLSAYSNDLEAKRVELLHELVPRAVRIAGMYNMSNPVVPPQWEQLEKTARSFGLEAKLLDVRTPGDITRAFNIAAREHVEAFAVGVDALTQANRKVIADQAIKHRLPAIYVSREYVDAGGLMAYGASYPELYRRAATYIDKIFKGAKPSELPIEQPTKFELIVNLRTAKAIGLAMPKEILLRADEVIQ
jgi:putative ABC transport system substrate-binding protein